MKKVLKIGIAVLLVLIAALSVGFWWFFIRDDAPAKASLDNLTSGTTATTAVGASTPVSAPATADGTWTVAPGDNVFAGYRIDEQYAGATVKHTVVGRSPGVIGTLAIQGSNVTAADIGVDMTQLHSDQARRDNLLHTQGLEIDRFPTAAFKLGGPIALGAAPALGQEIQTQATGDLTLHGVTKPVTVQITARWDGEVVNVVGSTPIVLGDYGIAPPNVGGFVSVDGNGTVEFQLAFRPKV
jgi:polyisoprenoid-binding protein YceI